MGVAGALIGTVSLLSLGAGEKSGVGLLLAGLIPIVGLALVAGLIWFAVRRSR